MVTAPSPHIATSHLRHCSSWASFRVSSWAGRGSAVWGRRVCDVNWWCSGVEYVLHDDQRLYLYTRRWQQRDTSPGTSAGTHKEPCQGGSTLALNRLTLTAATLRRGWGLLSPPSVSTNSSRCVSTRSSIVVQTWGEGGGGGRCCPLYSRQQQGVGMDGFFLGSQP